ncbi:hypothetical protein AB0K80_19630 [Streptomyces sp. NPDC052682]|uniref:hypothetical protein n=1 Tax=Streptomyces sp. NPDC052682 TaxID=3154954 RepID=UPI00341CFDDD
MERAERFQSTRGLTGQPESASAEVDELARTVPPRLAEFLSRLAYLAPTGQQLALEMLGPGSRLVLEALRLVETGRSGGLTERGRLVSERLADHPSASIPEAPDNAWQVGSLRQIARIIPVGERDLAAAATDDEESGKERAVVYELSPSSEAASATVEVIRVGPEYWLWQRSGPDKVVVVESMEALPSSAEPFILSNPGDEAPSQLLRTKLALSRESYG